MSGVYRTVTAPGRLAVLGGSWFLGRSIVEHAQSLGWEVTTFRRGRSGIDVPGVATIRGDRTSHADLERLAAAGPWDVVIDTAGYVPREAGVMARALEPATGQFVFVSSVSAYADWPTEPVTESSPLLKCPPDAGADYGFNADPAPLVYGFTKAGCERAVLDTFGPQRTTILRPGAIVGPREYVDRLPWWLRRVARGGRILAPGQPTRLIQPADVRDVAQFAITAPAGVFNVTGTHSTMQHLLSACHAVTRSSGRFEWITDEQWLAAQGVAQWTELPLWRTYRGTWAVDTSAATAAGLRQRPLHTTVADTWTWMQSGDRPVEHQRGADQGITPDKESAILGTWDARELDHCG